MPSKTLQIRLDDSEIAEMFNLKNGDTVNMANFLMRRDSRKDIHEFY